MKHKHEKIEIVSEYRNDHPTVILAVYCEECEQFFLDLMGELQDRENEGFALRGDSGVHIMNPNWDYARQNKYYHPIELESKGLSTN